MVVPGDPGVGSVTAGITGVHIGNERTMAQQVLSDSKEDPGSVLPFDWPWDLHETIWPCRDCLSWRAELFLVDPDDAIWVREWHAVECLIWTEIDGLDA